MERHKCKLCSRTFANGRALGGHMKAHLATLPLPPSKPHHQPPLSPSASFSSSYSSSSQSESEHEEAEEKALALTYVLRENPKKSFRLADPEFSFPADTGGGSVVVQDRESETESKNPTRTRSKRTRRSAAVACFIHSKKPKPSFTESPAAPQSEPASSVSDTSPEEDVAMCLMMLSRDRWSRNTKIDVVADHQERDQKPKRFEDEEGIKLNKKKVVRGRHNCGKTFRSSGALGSHKSTCLSRDDEEGASKIFRCPFCSKVFGSGQALGGHKRSHLIMPPSSSTAANANTNNNNNNHHSSSVVRLSKFKECFIDLNLPAPTEDNDDLSVVSDA